MWRKPLRGCDWTDWSPPKGWPRLAPDLFDVCGNFAELDVAVRQAETGAERLFDNPYWRLDEPQGGWDSHFTKQARVLWREARGDSAADFLGGPFDDAILLF